MERKEWCPLFGALPKCMKRDGVTERCITIIEEARTFWGGFEYLPGLSCPDPDKVEAHTGFPAILIKSARLLCDDSSFILSDAQHMQGSIGPCDVDQIDEDILLDVIGLRAGIDIEFRLDYLTAEKAFALMAIGEVWNLIIELMDGEELAESQQVAMHLLDAEKLLKAAHASVSETPQCAGRDAAKDGRKNGKSKQTKTVPRNKAGAVVLSFPAKKERNE